MPAADPITLAANRSLLASDPEQAFLVERGHVLLFAVETIDGAPGGQRYLVATLEPGDLIVGVPLGDDRPLALLLVGSGEAAVTPVALDALCRGDGEHPGAAGALEGWVRTLSGRIARNRFVPSELMSLPDEPSELGTGQAARPGTDAAVVHVRRGLVGLCGTDAATAGPEDPPLLVGKEAWVEAVDDSSLEPLPLAAAVGEPWLTTALRRFTDLCLLALAQEVMTTMAFRRDETQRLNDADADVQRLAVEELASTLSSRRATRLQSRHRDPAIVALEVVLRELGVTLAEGDPALQHIDPTLPVEDRVRLGARAASCRARTVTLPERWWRQDLGPLVATLGEDRRPVALVHGWNGYVLHDASTHSSRPVDPALAREVGPEALMLYRPLADEARRVRSLIHLGLNGSSSDVVALLVFGSVAGIASLITPVLTGLVFNDIIPSDERGRLGVVVLTLALVAFGVAFGSLARGVAFIRIRARFSNNASSALWDRLLRLPAGFFSKHLSGTLASRVRAVEMVQQILTDSVVVSVLNGVFSLFNLALFYVAGGTLFLVGIGLVALQLSLIVVSALVQIGRARGQIAAQNRTQGLGLQLIRGIDKLRVAAAERRGFATWAHRFSQQSTASYRAGRIGLPIAVLNASWSTLATLTVTGVVASAGLGKVSVGSFIEFTTALAQATGAISGMVAGLGTLATVVPILELPAPVFETDVETGTGREMPGLLSGAVEVNHVSFRYQPDGPLVLDDVSISAAPGDFVAIVGPSGAGKSSVIRLLLGFEVPELGTVTYDEKDLQTLDTLAVRRQIGTVIQAARLLPGTVMSNISGGATITRDEAWEAAAAAGVDGDIRAMPMGMETVIAEGGGVVSGGQRQRIIIARALALKPRVVLFDEATSALDNITQGIVTQSLARLQITRVVIAHRLSTVRDAHRIYVLDRGRVVEVGTYDELMAHDGVFSRLARRQLV